VLRTLVAAPAHVRFCALALNRRVNRADECSAMSLILPRKRTFVDGAGTYARKVFMNRQNVPSSYRCIAALAGLRILTQLRERPEL
jgi:hypothetical protein